MHGNMNVKLQVCCPKKELYLYTSA